MKKLFVCLGLLAFAAFVACAEEENPKVRFSNTSSTIELYGVRLSTAQVVPLKVNTTSEYMEISEGAYLLEGLNSSGTWVAATTTGAKASVKKGKKYTITYNGSSFTQTSPSVVDSEKNTVFDETLSEDAVSSDIK